MGPRRKGQMAQGNGIDDAVFGIKAREKWSSDQSQGAEQGCDPSDGHVLSKATHVSDVLVVMNAHDDGARTQEEKRFEKSMGHQVKDGDWIS